MNYEIDNFSQYQFNLQGYVELENIIAKDLQPSKSMAEEIGKYSIMNNAICILSKSFSIKLLSVRNLTAEEVSSEISELDKMFHFHNLVAAVILHGEKSEKVDSPLCPIDRSSAVFISPHSRCNFTPLFNKGLVLMLFGNLESHFMKNSSDPINISEDQISNRVLLPL